VSTLGSSTPTAIGAQQLQSLLDREAVRDTIYRYGSTMDSFDHEGIRSVLADDLWAKYANDEPIVGGDHVAAWIMNQGDGIVLRHHFLNVYSVGVDGDTASALVYHTSHQFEQDHLDCARILVGRYRMQLARAANGGGWRISLLEMEVLWAERRHDATQFLRAIGGRGPATVQPRVPVSR
jgi:hypothetical protein